MPKIPQKIHYPEYFGIFESFLVVFLALSRDFTIQAVYVARKAAEGYAGQERDPRKTRERPAKKIRKRFAYLKIK